MDNVNSDHHINILWGGVALVLAILSYLGLSSTNVKSKTEQQAKAWRELYNSSVVENTNEVSAKDKDDGSLEVGEIWIYPIKSLRGTRVSNALITPEGFYLDRRYMLLKVNAATATEPAKLQNMHVPVFPTMFLFQVSISSSGATFIVTFNPPSSPESPTHEGSDQLEVPSEPGKRELAVLERVDVNMYTSCSSGYNMGTKYNDWFSARFGFPVILAFWGGNARPVLGNLPGRPASEVPKPKNALIKILASVPVLGDMVIGTEEQIAFNDMAPFLVVNEASVTDVASRIGQQMDPSKFRPNIIIRGSPTAFDEDFWSELTFSPNSEAQSSIVLTANCLRCASLNVDYNTGAPGKGKDGEVLKLLQKDRRVDKAKKYSPVFGRYGFPGKGQGQKGVVLRVGQEAVISRRNEERTTFVKAWPGV